MAHTFRRYTILGAIAAAIVAPAIALGIAAPAQALQAPPVAPPRLNVPSSVIGGAVGGNGTSGAQLGGQIAAGTKGSPAFGAGLLTKAGQAVSNYNLGTFIGGAVDQAFGIDRDGTVCTATGQDFGGSVLRFLSGAECDAYDYPTTYTPNADASASPPGWKSSHYVWGGSPNPTAADFTWSGPDGLTPSQSGQFSIKVNFPGNPPVTAQSITPFSLLCQGGTNWTLRGTSVNIGPAGPYPNTLSCGSGEQIVAFGRLTSVTAGAGAPSNSGGALYVKIGTNSSKDYYAQENGYDPLWFSNLTSNYPPGTSADPDRQLVCTITTTTGQALTAATAPFKESAGSFPDPNCPSIPAGSTAGHMTITLTGGPQVLTLYDQDSTAPYQAANQAYPLCANGTCQLDLLDSSGSCYQGDVERCATWFSDPNRDSKYTCKYGTYTTPLKECFALANAFDLAKVAAGNGIADPATGTDTGTQTSVKPDAGGAPDPADAGDERQACFPTGWGVFNPLNWVLQPVKCALNWAFVPRASKMNELSGNLKSTVSGTALAGVQAGLSGLSALPFGDGGCGGIPLDASIFSEHIHIDLLRACPGDSLAPAASLTKTVISGAIVVAGGLACLRYIANIFGFAGFGRIGATVGGPRFQPAPEDTNKRGNET